MSKCYEIICEGKVNRFITVEANNEEEAKKAAALEFSLLVGANKNEVEFLHLEECEDD